VSNDDASNNAVNNIDPHEDCTSGGSTNGRHDTPPPGALVHDMTRARQSPMPGWLGSSAAELLGPRLVLSTQDQGYTAALNGDHVDTCPWRAAQNDQERALRQMWIRGYSAGRTDLRIARDPGPADPVGHASPRPPTATEAADMPRSPSPPHVLAGAPIRLHPACPLALVWRAGSGSSGALGSASP
jgi:ribosome modulation factor